MTTPTAEDMTVDLTGLLAWVHTVSVTFGAQHEQARPSDGPCRIPAAIRRAIHAEERVKELEAALSRANYTLGKLDQQFGPLFTIGPA